MASVNSELNNKIIFRYEKAMSEFKHTFDFHMSIIVDEILKEIKPISIYLIGSYGRNEGSIFLSKGNITPVRDYDVVLVVDRYVDKDVLNKLIVNINNYLGFGDPFLKTYEFKGFVIWLTQVELKGINAMPLLKYYELKENSILLWGKKINDDININIQNLSNYNCVLILFSKIETLLNLLDIDKLNVNGELKGEAYNTEIIDLVFECLKSYVEFGTCLSLLIGKYEPTFLKRCVLVSKHFNSSYPELFEMNPDLGNMMVNYASRRLLIEPEFLENLDLCKFLIETQKDLRIVIWYYVWKTYNLNFDSKPTSIYVYDDYIKNFNVIPLRDLFDNYIRSKLGFNFKLLNEIAIICYIRYTLIIFLLNVRKSGYKIRYSMLFTKNSNIMIRLWSIGFMLLDCLKENSHIDEDLLDYVEKQISQIIEINYEKGKFSNVPLTKFSYLQKIVVELIGISDRVFHRMD